MFNLNNLAVAAEATRNWTTDWKDIPAFSGERLALAGQVTLIGMLMIFSVLTILWGVLAIFKLIFAKAPKKAKAEPAPKAEPKVSAPEASAPVAVTDDAQLIAVITAAVAAYREAETPGATPSGFRVVSYRRANSGRAWNSK